MDYLTLVQQYSHYIFLVLFIAWLLKGPILGRIHGIQYMTVSEVYEIYKSKRAKAVLLDVRTKWEIQRGPRMKGTKNIPSQELSIRKEELQKGGLDQLIIIVCNSAKGRARNSAINLKKLGFTNVKIMKDGLIAWKGAKYPLG